METKASYVQARRFFDFHTLIPKSVRQIGDVKGRCKIYVEDYVITFAKRLVKEAEGSEAAGVLLGHRMFRSHEKLFQISGMVVIHDFAERKGDSFSSIFYINFTSSLYIPYLPHTFWCFPIHDKTSLSLHVTL